MTQIDSLPILSSQLERATSYDPVLSKVIQYTRQGWPAVISDELKPYYVRRHELTLESNCLLWGIRVIIPHKFQKKVLYELHDTHMGICRMKALAWSHVWWPRVDQEIESVCTSCEVCLSNRNTPAPAPLHPWAWPQKPWQRIHINFAGPVFGKTYLLMIDANSKWPEIWEISQTISAQTINILRQVFSIFGLPEQIVSDNGTQFMSEEFNVFCRKNGIKHIRSVPYHPATNGAVERFVQTFKRALKSGRKEGRDTQHVISNFLLRYRSTPHTLTGVSPCTLMLKRDIRTQLHLLRPDRESRVISGQASQKSNHDKRCKMREFKVGESVMVRNYRTSGDKWISGVITHKNGDLSYEVKLQSGNYCKRHIDQIVERGNFV